MNCQRCQKNHASVAVTEVHSFAGPGSTKNEVRQMQVCDECAQSLDLPFAPPTPATEVVTDNIWKLLKDSARKAREQARTLRCTSCGMTLEELQRHGRLGCPRDYEVFEDYLGELLERYHGSRTHVGRVPGIGEGELERIQRVTDLKGTLDIAIRNEDYEQAASIRDELKLLETEQEPS